MAVVAPCIFLSEETNTLHLLREETKILGIVRSFVFSVMFRDKFLCYTSYTCFNQAYITETICCQIYGFDQGPDMVAAVYEGSIHNL